MSETDRGLKESGFKILNLVSYLLDILTAFLWSLLLVSGSTLLVGFIDLFSSSGFEIGFPIWAIEGVVVSVSVLVGMWYLDTIHERARPKG